MHRWIALVIVVAGPGWTRPAAAGTPVPTYHGAVSRILRARCEECHRPGQVAPFPLQTYEQARKRADDIARVVGDRAMPPWHASTGEGVALRDPRVLAPAEVAALAAWAEGGAPAGDEADSPPPRDFPAEWPLGEPDLVLRPAEPYPLAASGADEFRVFVLPTGLVEGRWVQAIDFPPEQPGGGPPRPRRVRDEGEGPQARRRRPRARLRDLRRLPPLARGGARRLGPRQGPPPPRRRGGPLPPAGGRPAPAGPLPPDGQARGRRDGRRPLFRQNPRPAAAPRHGRPAADGRPVVHPEARHPGGRRGPRDQGDAGHRPRQSTSSP